MAEVLDRQGRVLDGARLAAAGALEAAVEGDDDEAFLGQGRAVNLAGRLFLATADRWALMMAGYLRGGSKAGGKWISAAISQYMSRLRMVTVSMGRLLASACRRGRALSEIKLIPANGRKNRAALQTA
ncbi:hypothetical protein [Brevundimonas diminuta]